jgi:hypothetical protein
MTSRAGTNSALSIFSSCFDNAMIGHFVAFGCDPFLHEVGRTGLPRKWSIPMVPSNARTSTPISEISRRFLGRFFGRANMQYWPFFWGGTRKVTAARAMGAGHYLVWRWRGNGDWIARRRNTQRESLAQNVLTTGISKQSPNEERRALTLVEFARLRGARRSTTPAPSEESSDERSGAQGTVSPGVRSSPPRLSGATDQPGIVARDVTVARQRQGVTTRQAPRCARGGHVGGRTTAPASLSRGRSRRGPRDELRSTRLSLERRARGLPRAGRRSHLAGGRGAPSGPLGPGRAERRLKLRPRARQTSCTRLGTGKGRGNTKRRPASGRARRHRRQRQGQQSGSCHRRQRARHSLRQGLCGAGRR